MLPEPPRIFPRGIGVVRWLTSGAGGAFVGPVEAEPMFSTQRDGLVMVSCVVSAPPASSRRTRAAPSSISRRATTQPADPAPTTM